MQFYRGFRQRPKSSYQNVRALGSIHTSQKSDPNGSCCLRFISFVANSISRAIGKDPMSGNRDLFCGSVISNEQIFSPLAQCDNSVRLLYQSVECGMSKGDKIGHPYGSPESTR